MSICNGPDVSASITACTAILLSKPPASIEREALRNRGIRYHVKGDSESAIADFDAAIRLDSGSALLFALRGSSYARQDKYDLARIDLDKAIQLDPKLALAYLGRSYLGVATGKLDAAISDADEVISLDPRQAGAYSNRGAALREKGDFARSLEDLNVAIRLSPNLAGPLYQRGLTYSRMGDPTRALADYDAALALNPNATDAKQARETALALLPNRPSPPVAQAAQPPAPLSATSPAPPLAPTVQATPAIETPAPQVRPSTTYGVVRYGTSDSAIGRLSFLSRGPVANRVFAVCKMSDLCEVKGYSSGDTLTRVVGVKKVEPFVEPAQLLRYFYGLMVGDHDFFWLEDSDLEAIYTRKMADLLRASRRASKILGSESVGASPWINGQESDIRNVKIEIDPAGPGRALGIATFRNFSTEDPRPTTYTFDLIRTAEGWRVDDQQFEAGGGSARFGNARRLSAMLKVESWRE